MRRKNWAVGKDALGILGCALLVLLLGIINGVITFYFP